MMILRRPYAFLTRHIRFIHGIMLICSIFILYKTFNIISFFGSYIKRSGNLDVTDVYNTYVTSSMYVSSLIIIIVSGIVIYLLNHKKKNIIIYLITIIFYAVMMIAFFLLSSFLYNLQFDSPSIRLINIVRDVFRFTTLIQIAAIGLFAVRTLGFDFKHFDFKKDILDLGIEKKDNEEYEFEVKYDKEKTKAYVFRKARYFKYFYKENKYIFIFLYFVIAIVILSLTVKFILGIEKVYKEGEVFSDDYFNMKVIDTYKTTTDSSGNKINNKYFYIIMRIDFQNKKAYETYIGTEYFKLSYGDYELLEPIVSENSRFTEFGVNYYSQYLKENEERIFNFIYKVPIEFYNETFYLKYLYDITYKKNEAEYKYRKVKLNLKEFNKDKENISTTTLGNKLNFDKSLLGNTTIQIDNVELSDTFYYNLVKCRNSICDRRKMSITATASENFDLTLMRLHYNIDFDYDKLGSKYINDTFISKFGKIRFEVNGKEYNNRLVLRDVTPFQTDNYVFIEVRDKLKLADKIYLDFVIRDKVYTYIIKDTTVKEKQVDV